MTDQPQPDVPRPGSTLPSVSVIVPVKDGFDRLRECVDALLAQDYPSDQLQLLVVDNGSKVSPTTVLPSDRRLRVLAEPIAGSYRARNLALQHATGDLIAFTDADCLPAADWVREAAGYLTAHPTVDMVGGRVDLTYQYGRPVSGAEWFEFVEGFPQESYIASGFAVTANMITRRTVFDRVGTFAADLQSGGDAEWGRRVRDAGGRQDYLPAAMVRHPARDTWAELRTKTVRTTGGIVDKLLAKPGAPKRLARLLAGQGVRSVRALAGVWRQPTLPTLSARLKFLGTRLRVNAVVAGVLSRALLGRLTGRSGR